VIIIYKTITIFLNVKRYIEHSFLASLF